MPGAPSLRFLQGWDSTDTAYRAFSLTSRADPYRHVKGNLYVVLTPLKEDGKQSAIEDSFADEIINLKLNGKMFTTKNKFDTENYFGRTSSLTSCALTSN